MKKLEMDISNPPNYDRTALQRLMKTMKKKAPNALALIRRDSISSDSGSISDPETPGVSMTEEEFQNSFTEAAEAKTETPTSELLRKVKEYSSAFFLN